MSYAVSGTTVVDGGLMGQQVWLRNRAFTKVHCTSSPAEISSSSPDLFNPDLLYEGRCDTDLAYVLC